MIASLFRRGSRGLWQCKIQLDSWPRERRFSLGTTDKRVAQTKLQAKLAAFEKEAAGILPPLTVREAAQRPLPELIERFLADMTARDKSAATVKRYGLVLRNLSTACGWGTLAQVTAASFCEWRQDCRLRPVTQNHCQNTWSRFFRWLMRQRLALENPFGFVERADTRRTVREYRAALTVEQVDALLKNAPAHRATIYRLVLETGIRRTEMRRLRVADILLGPDGPNRAEGRTHDHDQTERPDPQGSGRAALGRFGGGGSPALRGGGGGTPQHHREQRLRHDQHDKTPKTTACIRLPGSITKNGKPALQSISATLAQLLAVHVSPDSHPNAPAFPAGIPRGSTFRRDLARAGIPAVDEQGRRLDLHALRKTLGTHLVLSGASPRVVMEVMRHSDLKLTMKTYMDAAQLQGPVIAAVAALPWNQTPATPGEVAS